MNESIWTIPLFPLETVLFPYTALPLHIFEPRYREMVMHCLETDTPFGVVLIREGREVADPEVQVHEVGTLARIGRLRRQPDGRLHLLALGEERFQIVRLIRHEAPYLKAHVRLWRDHEPFDWDTEQQYADAVAQRFREFLHLALDAGGLRVDDIELPHSPTALSFAIAGTLQLEMPLRQYLLELQDARERLRLVEQVLETLTQALTSTMMPYNPDHWREYVNPN
ncbi:MAG: LON peptidase substrate-binding domain-containing protein [Fimbriimonadales bacterium]